MSLCEYDRKIITELRNVLYEIRDVLKEVKLQNETALNYMVRKNNKQATINQKVKDYHLNLLHEANEDDI